MRSLDALLQRLVHLPQLGLGLFRQRHVMGDADKAEMVAVRIEPRLRLRAQPAPFAVGALVARFQHERLQRRFSGDLLLHDARQIIRVDDLAPVEQAGVLERQAEEIHVGPVDETTGAVELGHPHRDRRGVRDLAEALFALAQLGLGVLGLRHVVADADEADVLAVDVEARQRFRMHPAPIAVAVAHPRLQRERLLHAGICLVLGDDARNILLAQHARQVVRVDRVAPVVGDRLLRGEGEEVEIGLVDEGAGAVEVGHPHRHRR